MVEKETSISFEKPNDNDPWLLFQIRENKRTPPTNIINLKKRRLRKMSYDV
jgi:hypothetical protein